MNIRVKITRDKSNRIVTMDLEEYLRGVVPSEMPSSSHLEALKAQAVAARTYAAHKIATRSKQAFDVDDTTAYQAYRPGNTNARTDQAITATAGEVLHYGGKIIDTAVYGASNGGYTVSAQQRWKNPRAYLPAQTDPWDAAAGYARNGHGVGLSQRGAMYAAQKGSSYRQILSFYYPGTVIVKEESGGSAEASRPELRLGSVHEDVADLEHLLIAKGFLPKRNKADAALIEAVTAFQRASGLKADGIAGEKTWAALEG